MSSALVAAILAVLTLPSEWAQPGYGPGATYYNPGETRLTAATVGTAVERWAIKTHDAPDCEVGREPLAAYGKVFSSDPGGVGAYDPVTGQLRWHAPLSRRGVTRMAVSGGSLVTLTYACDTTASFLTAFRTSDGARQWEIPVGGLAQDMVVDRGVVVVDTRPDFALATTGYRLTDGTQLWQLTGTRGDGLLSSGGRLLLRTEKQGTRVVSVADGTTVWEKPRNWYAVGSDPAGTRFYIGGSGTGLAAVDAATGTVLWSSDQPAPNVTADDRHVYVPRQRTMICLDARTGKRLWAVHLGDGAGQPVSAGGLLYSPAGIDEPLSVVDVRTGRPVRTAKIPSTQNYAPMVAGGRLFVTDGDRLRAYF
ncbi:MULTISPECIES: PQQ-binding-like beta-propeller repeat protein [Actinoplanes]|uniref:outer membrane protein assembly factor BamB family protein n=1 Tax=Actinoplanes TaxID=1865 RepID=UPI0005F27E68|nr:MULTISPECIES: PQQ-binding-like beta-propeller repeat protein [Actinoplanes]GLY08063.1 hypothetical protein Acsp01_84420 [Actinoplanes sp. NBRC 101535]